MFKEPTCGFRFKNNRRCRRKRDKHSRFCSIHDPVRPIVRITESYGEYVKGSVMQLPKTEAGALAALGVVRYLDKNLTRAKLLKILNEAIIYLRNAERGHLVWMIRTGDDETLRDWLSEKPSIKGKIKAIEEFKFSLADRLYLVRLAGVPPEKLIKIKFTKSKNSV